MPELQHLARVSLAGSTGVDHTAPLEDLVQETYRVARRYAELNGFASHVHNGVPGIKGPMVMKRILKQLFPGFDDGEFSRAQGLIYQVLRKTDAAVCLQHPTPQDDDDSPDHARATPVWFIANAMPENLVVVADLHVRRSAAQRPGGGFNEKLFLKPGEKKLRPEEVGETLPPGKVTVTRTDTAPTEPETETEGLSRRDEAFADTRRRRQEEHQRFVQRVLDEVRTNSIPMTPREIALVINRDDGVDFHLSTYRQALGNLVAEGKLVTRTESAEEAAVRGGGRRPKATRPTLYWVAPGPVPTRTRMPDGIEPIRPASDWSREAKERMDADVKRVTDAMARKGRRGDQAPRSKVRILEASGIDPERFEVVLEHMVRNGLLEKRSSGWYPVKSHTRVRKADPVQPKALPAEPDPVTVPPTVPDQGNLQLVLSLAEKLGVTLPSGDQERVESLERELHLALDDNDELQAKLVRANEQVTALRKAIATLG